MLKNQAIVFGFRLDPMTGYDQAAPKLLDTLRAEKFSLVYQ